MSIDRNGDDIERLYTREATDSLYDEVERHEATISKLTSRVVSAEQEAIGLKCDVDELEKELEAASRVSVDVRPMRVHGESVGVLVDELETVEAELFDARTQLFEEVRLCKVLTDEIANLERDLAATNEAYWHHVKRAHKRWLDQFERAEALEAKSFVESKRGRWVGVAMAGAFVLGGYFGFILGCAS